jgi:arylsulfatase A-like enzyme
MKKAILVMFDSLNRNLLPPYGGTDIHAPNFTRLAKQSVTFENSYVCSMPCMPARRDLHTARPNFFHTPWSCLQPWDDSVPEMLKQNGISSHLVTDHYHYMEDGGAGYMQRYSTYQCFRGQEGDPWIGQADPPEVPEHINGKDRPQDWVNRQFMREDSDFSQKQTFDAGIDFLERNHNSEAPWFLQIETFDPHEPFLAPDATRKLYDHAGESPIFDWPGYQDVTETPGEQARAVDNYKALVSFCDQQLGRVLDFMDEHAVWDDTLLIVCTDHGFLLGEHNRWAKNIPTLWNEIARTPFFVWDPRSGKKGERREALVQPVLDIGPTLLNLFGLQPTKEMTGKDLTATVTADTPVRDAAVFGYFGYPLNVTDGSHVYMRNHRRADIPLYEYNWMPNTMRDRFSPEEFTGLDLSPPLPFTKNIPVPRFPRKEAAFPSWNAKLFNLAEDPGQETELKDPDVEARMVEHLSALMREAHAPEELFNRFALRKS